MMQGLDLIDFYVLPHYLTAPFKKVTEKIMTEFGFESMPN